MKHLAFFLVALLLLGACKPKQEKPVSSDISGELIIFHAGSLSVPLKEMKEAFELQHPEVHIVLEAAGSITCARKITDLKRPCDVMASADYQVINKFLVPEYADSALPFATNEMAIVYHPDSKFADQINVDNWYDILQREEVIYGRSDPHSDPCGYRSILTIKLAEQYYDKAGLTENLLQKDNEFIRPKASDLIALLQTNNLDYIFEYRSVAQQFGLPYLVLPDSINLKNFDLANHYKTASVEINGKKPGEKTTQYGEPMIYGITQVKTAPNPRGAKAFIDFLFSEQGMEIIEKNGQTFFSMFQNAGS